MGRVESAREKIQHTLHQYASPAVSNTNVVFYCRQFWTYNLEIRNISWIYMAMWSEDEASHGSSEKISCIHANLDSVKPDKKTLVAWFASCGCLTVSSHAYEGNNL
jgi:hypothetical protein